MSEFRAGCLIVSHDREFLKRTCTHTLELARGQLTLFPGNVDTYLANVEERNEHARRVNAATLSKRKQLEEFIAKNRARASTATQAKSKAKQLERLAIDSRRWSRVERELSLSRHRNSARPRTAHA